jgi:hypothetical protein
VFVFALDWFVVILMPTSFSSNDVVDYSLLLCLKDPRITIFMAFSRSCLCSIT